MLASSKYFYYTLIRQKCFQTLPGEKVQFKTAYVFL